MRFIIILSIILLWHEVKAQHKFADLNQYLQAVRTGNPLLKAEDLNEEINQMRLRSAWSAMFPQVRAFASFDNNINLPVQLVPAQVFGGPEGEFAEVKFGTRYNTSYGAEASLPLINISNWKNISATEYAYRAAQYQVKDKELTLNEQATTAYYFTLLSFEAVKISQELLSAADSLLKAAQIRLSNGLIEPMEFNRVKSIHLETSQQLSTHRVALEKNLNAMKKFAGLNLKDTISLEEKVFDISGAPTESSLEISSSNLPAYHMFSFRSMQAAEELKKQRAKIFPEVSLFARFSKQSFSNETNIFSVDQPWYDITVAGLRAEWNLFTGFNRQSQIRQANLRSQQTEWELKNYVLQTENELETLKADHKLSREAVEKYHEQFQLNSVNYRIAGKKYDEGIYTIDQYINIYQELIRAQNQYLSALANYLMYESIIKSRNSLK